jgi:hypothetical protein
LRRDVGSILRRFESDDVSVPGGNGDDERIFEEEEESGNRRPKKSRLAALRTRDVGQMDPAAPYSANELRSISQLVA